MNPDDSRQEPPASAPAEEAAPAADTPAKPDPPRRPAHPALIRAFRTKRAVQGKVAQLIKGGYEVNVGRARGFCPRSQMVLAEGETPESPIGQSYLFRITQLRHGGDDLVVSRRVLIEEERAEEAKAVRATLIEGAVMQGHVSGLADFGAFVDLGAGVTGLVHVSELSHSRVARVADAVQVGQTVQVKILKMDEGRGRLSLSMRGAQEDPWQGSAERYAVGQVYPGIVRRLTDFGAFVELEPSIEALAPANELPPTPGGWKEGLEPGAEREWYVLSIDPAKRRASVTLTGDAAATTVEVGAATSGRIQRVERFGVFVWLAPGRVGLLPNIWTGTPPGTDLAKSFRVGEEIAVTVQEVADGRIRLSKTGVEIKRDAPQRERRPKRAKPEPQPVATEPQEPFGTNLAEKLRAALGRGGSD